MVHLNGVCVGRLVADSKDITHKFFILFKGCSRGYATNEDAEQVCRTHAKLLRQLDVAFSCLRQVGPTRERIRDAKMVHLRTGAHKTSWTTGRSMSLIIRLSINHHTQRCTG